MKVHWGRLFFGLGLTTMISSAIYSITKGFSNPSNNAGDSLPLVLAVVFMILSAITEWQIMMDFPTL